MAKQILYSLALISICLLAGCSNDNGTGGNNLPPTISSIDPNQVSLGQNNITGHIQGTNLSGVTSISFGGGISIQSFRATSSNEIEVVFSVENNAIPGGRTVTVNTTGGSATASVLTILNNKAPVARFTVFPTSGGKNTNYTFDASSSKDSDGTVLHFHWNFGDDQTANGQVVQHVFNAAGTYVVALVVQDEQNATATATINVKVNDEIAPTPDFTITPSAGDVTTNFHFDASASSDDGTIKSYEWHMGDGAVLTGVTVDHIFKESGKESVELIVKDNDGNVNILEKTLKVKDFDTGKAVMEIQNLITRFFFRYSQLETQSAEYITEGWNDDCPGRQHEINIINKEKTQLLSTNATITEPIEVSVGSSHLTADASVTARFDYTTLDEVDHTAICTHSFTLKFVGDEWQICDFIVACQ
jgi:chitodextrinase